VGNSKPFSHILDIRLDFTIKICKNFFLRPILYEVCLMKIKVKADVPGIDKKDISITLC